MREVKINKVYGGVNVEGYDWVEELELWLYCNDEELLDLFVMCDEEVIEELLIKCNEVI